MLNQTVFTESTAYQEALSKLSDSKPCCTDVVQQPSLETNSLGRVQKDSYVCNLMNCSICRPDSEQFNT